ncbi:MAG: hypothetical protein R2874_13390 [Desulfobacterales bacterium]
MEVLKTLTLKNMQEYSTTPCITRDEIKQLFKHGNISLREGPWGRTFSGIS